MRIDGASAKSGLLRVLFSIGDTAAIGSGLFLHSWLSGAYQQTVPPQVEIGLKAKR
jgi:hypothetical protein